MRWHSPWAIDREFTTPGQSDGLHLSAPNAEMGYIGLFTADDDRTALEKFTAQWVKSLANVAQTFQAGGGRIPMSMVLHYTVDGVPWDGFISMTRLVIGRSVLFWIFAMPSATSPEVRTELGHAVSLVLPPAATP